MITYFTSIACSCAVLVKYLITRPSAALFLNHMFVLSLCRCVVLVKVCYAYEVFDNAAFGRVIFKSTFLLSWCSCVVIVNVCCAGCWLLAAGYWPVAAGCWLGNLKESPLGSKGNWIDIWRNSLWNLREVEGKSEGIPFGISGRSIWILFGI